MCPLCSMSKVPFEDFLLYILSTASEESQLLTKHKRENCEFSSCPDLQKLVRSTSVESVATTNSNDSASSYYLTENVSSQPKVSLMRTCDSCTKAERLVIYPEKLSPTHNHRSHDLSFYKNFSAVSSTAKRCSCKCSKCIPLSTKRLEEDLELSSRKKLSRSTPIHLEIVGIVEQSNEENCETRNHSQDESPKSNKEESNQRDYILKASDNIVNVTGLNSIPVVVQAGEEGTQEDSNKTAHKKTVIDPTLISKGGEALTITTSTSNATSSSTTMSLFLDSIRVTQEFDTAPQQLRIFYKY